jgi:GTP-binding protein Era
MSETACGFVALIGAPNAGKSTLINALVGAKVAAVSRKAQMTRAPTRGIFIEGAAQIILVDTPGLFTPQRRLDRAMTKSAWQAAEDADCVVLLIDARAELRSADTPLSDETLAILAALSSKKPLKILALNKIDAVDRPALLGLAARINQRLAFDETFMISALTGDGLAELRKALAKRMKPGPWLYPEDQISGGDLRTLAAEITREKLFERLHDELPYQATVETDQWRELPDGAARIEQTIYVARESHRKIVLGEGGRTIKAIGTAARLEIAEANEAPVHLFLFVKVRKDWAEDPERYRAMGLEFPKN